MKIFYFSITSFSDTDFGVLKHLAKANDVSYGVAIQKKNANFTAVELNDYCERHNISFHPFIFTCQQKNPLSLLLFYKVIKEIKKFNPDIIYIPTFDHIFFSVLSILLNKRKTIIALHDVEFHSDTVHARILKVARWITMKKFENFQVFSKTQENIFKKNYPLKNVEVIPLPLKDYGNGNDFNIKCLSDEIKFLFFGNILPYKGLKVLLKALNNLYDNQSDLNFKLIVAGRCEDWEKEYLPLIKNKEMVKSFIGFIENDKIADLFKTAHYLVLPYKDATQSGPLKIAFNYNIPVIASNLQSFSEEIINEVNGYLYKCDDIKDLESVLVKVMKNHNAKYAILKLAQKAYVANIYSGDSIQRKFSSYFQRILYIK